MSKANFSIVLPVACYGQKLNKDLTTYGLVCVHAWKEKKSILELHLLGELIQLPYLPT